MWLSRLHKATEGRFKDEIRNAEMLTGCSLFLEGKSTVSKINPIHIGNTVEDQLNLDHESDAGAVANYKATITQAGELDDHGTRDMITSILREEEAILIGWKLKRIRSPRWASRSIFRCR